MSRFFSVLLFGVLGIGFMPASATVNAGTLAVIINDADPHSVEIGKYYAKARKIPPQNLIHIRLPGSPHTLSVAAFNQLKQEIDARLTPAIQALLMVWTAPYAVGCNSITAAISLGFDARLCDNSCAASAASNYYNTGTRQPFTDLGVRPSMLLPTDSIEQARALIDRGIQSEFRVAPASAYFLITSDPHRNSRAPFFPASGYLPQKKLTIRTLRKNTLANAQDIMIYQTGAARVSQLQTLGFRPGALADHLTSQGGDLLGTTQMSSLRWLEAGATASYGTVSEPCNYWQKFPNPGVLTRRYLSGDSALEAYWKSVAWPAQGVFIGEPLARPYRVEQGGP